jgi:predicted alpha/beta superfamily hydrolase
MIKAASIKYETTSIKSKKRKMASNFNRVIRKCFAVATGIVHISGMFVLLIFSSATANAQTQETADNSVPPEVTIAGTQLLHISSSITDKDYALYINLPGGYGDTTKTFPVLFVIDAQWDFPMIQSIYGQQYYDGFIPEMVIVGITWGGNSPDYDKLRAHDFTPTDISKTGTYGNASNFLSFISKELIPYIEGKFRVRQNDRTLVGSSYGGLFALYAMFQEPAVFNRFIFTSPAIEWDNKFIHSRNNGFAEQHGELAAKVFAGIGEHEDVKGFQAFIEEVKLKNYKNFELQTIVVQGMGHSGAKAEGYARGLQAVFSRPDIAVDSAILAAYTGKYSINSQYTITLLQEEGELVVITPDNSKMTLKATSDEDFHVTGQFLNIHFENESAGKVTGFTLHQYGGSMLFKKVTK